MIDTAKDDEKKFNETLKRMLSTPPKHEKAAPPKPEKRQKPAPKTSKRKPT
jgi:hypothetical protein